MRKPEYEEAIGIFLRKYGKRSYNFLQTLPRAARLSKISEYPKTVAAKLRELNLPEILKNESGDIVAPPEEESDILLIGCVIAALAVVALVILGIVKLYEIVF